MPTFSAIVPSAHEGRKLVRFARGEMHISATQFSAVKWQGGLRVNGEIVRADAILHAGDRVDIVLPEGGGQTVLPEEGEVRIVYEDEHLYIIDKSAPLACQCSDRNPTGTLENRLAAHYGAQAPFVFRPLNRLDKGTSGLMAAAKDAHSYQLLQKQLHTPDFVREYLAVAEGTLCGSGVWDFPIAKEDAASVRRVVDFENGKRAVTHWEALQNATGRTLLRLRLETGRTHQIRVHAAHAGLPLVGDFLYGTELTSLPGRFALHSAFLSLVHPLTGARLSFESALPRELQILLEGNQI